MSSISSLCRRVFSILLLILSGMLIFSYCGCRKEVSATANKKPVVRLIAPIGSVRIYTTDTLLVKAEASDPDGSISCVYFYIDNRLVFTDTQAPYEYCARNFTEGDHSVAVVAADDHQLLSNTDYEPVDVLSAGKFNISLSYSPYHAYNLVEGDSVVFKVQARSER
jgi:hypothetical protein